MSEKNTYSLRMRQLPKAEYRLMKALVQKYSLRDESELFAIALRLLTEVEIYEVDKHTGQKWISQVIDSFRSHTHADTCRQGEHTAAHR